MPFEGVEPLSPTSSEGLLLHDSSHNSTPTHENPPSPHLVELGYPSTSDHSHNNALSPFSLAAAKRPPDEAPRWAVTLSAMSATVSHHWRFGRGLISRRSIIVVVFGATLIFTIVSNVFMAGAVSSSGAGVDRAPPGRLAYISGIVAAPVRLKNAALQRLEQLRWESRSADVVYEPLRLDLVLNHAKPQESLKMQLKNGVRYVTGLSFGGHANQFIAIGKLLFLARELNRVAIIPTLLPVHFLGGPANFSDFFDLPRFYHESSIPAVEFAAVKPIAAPGTPHNEGLSCWSSHHTLIGEGNLQVHSFDIHNVWVDLWALPPMARGMGGNDLAFDALRIFDFDGWARNDWIERVKSGFLPQITPDFEGDRSKNVKPGFDPVGSPPPDDQILCLDNTLFLGPVMFPEAFPGDIPLENVIPGEGNSWKGATRYIHFTKEVEIVADEYLMRLFDVKSSSRIPPFISVHLRRGDFEVFNGGFTELEKYQRAVERVVLNTQVRLDNPDTWRGPGKVNFRSFGIPAAKYQVLTTTDEPTGSAFIDEVRALGWHVLDHGALNTTEERGGWWPTILDSAILARGQGFVGTDRSTFSHLAGLRVKYWHGGLVDIAL